MNVTINKDRKDSNKQFPRLMENKNGRVVLMLNVDVIVGEGVVLYDPTGCHDVGYKSNGWAMKGFHDFNGEITLSNY